MRRGGNNSQLIVTVAASVALFDLPVDARTLTVHKPFSDHVQFEWNKKGMGVWSMFKTCSWFICPTACLVNSMNLWADAFALPVFLALGGTHLMEKVPGWLLIGLSEFFYKIESFFSKFSDHPCGYLNSLFTVTKKMQQFHVIKCKNNCCSQVKRPNISS